MKTNFADYPQLIPLWIAVYIDILGYSLILPFMPFFMQIYHSNPLLIGLLLATNALFAFFCGPILGRLSDIYGRKPLLLICQIGTLIGFLMLAFSQSLWMLFLSRVIDGIFGGIYPITKAVIGDIVPPKERSKQMTNLGLGHTLASLIGPGIGGLLSRWGIIAPGLFAAALTILAFITTLVMFKESNPFAQTNPHELHKTVREADQKEKPQKVWKNPITLYLLIQWAFHTLAFTIFMSTLSLFAFIRFGLDAEQVGLLLMIGGFFRVIIRVFFFMPILNRLGERLTSILGLTIFTIIFFLLSFVTAEIQFVLILIASSFAASCARGVLNSFLSRSVSPKEQGKIMGMATSLDNFSQIVGPIIGGFFLGSLDLIWFGMLLAFFSAIPFAMSFRQFDFEIESRPPKATSKKELIDLD